MIENKEGFANLETTKETMIKDGWECLPCDDPRSLTKGYIFYKYLPSKTVPNEELNVIVNVPIFKSQKEIIQCSSLEEFNDNFQKHKNDESLRLANAPRELELGFTFLRDNIDYDVIQTYTLKVSTAKSGNWTDSKFDELKKILGLQLMENKIKTAYEVNTKETLSDESVDKAKQSLSDLSKQS